jgi:hypothetical protein
MWINGQRGIWLDPEGDPSGVPQAAIGKACAAWVTNNGCILAFLRALRSAGYLMVLVEPGDSMEPKRTPSEVRVDPADARSVPLLV